MRRKVEARAPQAISQHSSLLEETRTYRFITPVFGGGVRVKKDDPNKPHDEVTPVRVPSIRGQLRFWWRAVNPHRCSDEKALREVEAKVFGCAAGGKVSAGTLDIAVKKAPNPPDKLAVLLDGDKFRCLEGMQAIAYGAFPLRDKDGQKHGNLHVFKGDWTVRFRYEPAIAEDVQAALWAWAHFGGLGGRTRRGFGAIDQTSAGLLSVAEGWQHWKLEHATKAPWPHLRGSSAVCIVETKYSETGLGAQKILLKTLQELRQGSFDNPLGRNWRGHNDAGRSHWPEGDVLRRLTTYHHEKHPPRAEMNGFLRHKFGLPIIFHFKDGPKKGNRARPGMDPPECELVPQDNTRFASPLILRPYVYSKGSPTLYGSRALRLCGDEPTTLSIKGQSPVSGIATVDKDPLLFPFRQINPDATDVIDLYLQLLKTR